MTETKTKEFGDARTPFHTAVDLGNRMHHGLGKSVDYARNLVNDGQVSSTEYASDQLQHAVMNLSYEAGHITVDTAKGTFHTVHKTSDCFRTCPSVPTTPNISPNSLRNSIVRPAKKADEAIRHTVQSTSKTAIKTAQKAAKDGQRIIKASHKAVKTARDAAQTTKRAARASADAAKKAANFTRTAVKATITAAKFLVKAIAATAKAIAAIVYKLCASIASGGWIALVIIAVIIIILVIIIAVIGYLDPSIALPE